MAAFSAPSIFSPLTGFLSLLPWACIGDTSQEVIAYRGRHVEVIIPENPLIPGSFKIMLHKILKPAWSPESLKEAYELMQTIIANWKESGIDSYFVVELKDVFKI